MMEEENILNKLTRLYKAIKLITITVTFLFIATVYLSLNPSLFAEEKNVDDSIFFKEEARTELQDRVGIDAVIANCTGCHSAKLIAQNRATKERWLSLIRWMQATQNLWDLGENEAIILKYLAENYAPNKKGRRAALQDIEWYELKD